MRARKGKPAIVTPTASRASHFSRFVNRITIERGEDGYSFSALTNSAVVPVREVEVQPFFTTGIATQLRKGEGEESHETFGLLLLEYIFPEDFERMIDDGKSLTLVVDRDWPLFPGRWRAMDPGTTALILVPI